MRSELSRDYSNYRYQYFTGANIGLFIHDALLVNAFGVEFNLSQNKRPIYGYASQLWDGVADGTVLVNGVLYFNYQASQELPTLIARLKGQVHRLWAEANSSNTSRDIAKLVHERKQAVDGENLTDEEVNSLQSYYWGSTLDLAEFDPGVEVAYNRPDDHKFSFDITINYGDVFGNDVKRQNERNTAAKLEQDLRQYDQDASMWIGRSETRIIKSCEITGFGQTINVDGNPILEAYPFIAREVI